MLCNTSHKDYQQNIIIIIIIIIYTTGTTHFCDSCHTKQNTRECDYPRIPRSKLPQCKGSSTCVLGIDHPPAGTEHVLGCAFCRPRAPRPQAPQIKLLRN